MNLLFQHLKFGPFLYTIGNSSCYWLCGGESFGCHLFPTIHWNYFFHPYTRQCIRFVSTFAFMYIGVCVPVNVHTVMGFLQRPQKDIGSPGARLTEGCKSPSVSGNWMLGFYKQSELSKLLYHLSSNALSGYVNSEF